ncbi:MAG: large subunit ribosomal protein L14e [Candidatus Diapherotrites archaeon]|nr:large subunit ribosomal protein L14e [Candidatus Diapherotrites archaeon]
MVPGRVCVKVTGRDAGAKVVIVKNIDDVFAEVVTRGGKRRKVNKRHLLPTETIMEIEGLSDEEIAKKLEEA